MADIKAHLDTLASNGEQPMGFTAGEVIAAAHRARLLSPPGSPRLPRLPRLPRSLSRPAQPPARQAAAPRQCR